MSLRWCRHERAGQVQERATAHDCYEMRWFQVSCVRILAKCILLATNQRPTSDRSEPVRHAGREGAAYKYPRVVQFVDVLPKSGSGKVMWRALQEAEAGKA